MRKKSLLLISLLLASCGGQVISSSSGGVIYFSSNSSDNETSSNVLLEDNVFSQDELINKDNVKWQGRTQYKDDKVYFYYTGTGFKVTFQGSKLSAVLQATNTDNVSKRPYFHVFVDGEDLLDSSSFCLSKENSEITLCENLTYGIHTVEVLKRSEPYDSITSLSELKTDGTFIKQEQEDKLKMQLVGASGISGHGALGVNGEERTTENSSSLHAFGYLTARMFDADFEFIANAGCGLKWGYRNTNVRTAYDYVGLDTNCNVVDEKWDHSLFEPDIVLCNIGGNDYNSYVNNAEDQDQANKEFRDAVTEFLTHIHSLHPNAYIIWTHTNSKNGIQAETAIADYEKKELVKVVVIPKVGADGDLIGADNHNSIYTHIRTADILADAIEDFAKVTRVKENIDYKGELL